MQENAKQPINEIQPQFDVDQLFSFVEQWAFKRGLLKPEFAKTQMLKVMEELGETASAILKNDREKIKDGIGDCFVTLIILQAQLGFDHSDCLNHAYEEIKNRKGELINGSFIKE
jgi:NTP pyrophosphatase (non-canonical NTP hydrolase)